MPAAMTPDQFAAVLLEAAGTAVKETVQILGRGGRNIKRDGRANSIASSGLSAAAAPYKIEHDDVVAPGTIASIEVGYKGEGQGKLGMLLEYGGGGDASPPHLDLARALEAEDDRFTRAMADMGERVLR